MAREMTDVTIAHPSDCRRAAPLRPAPRAGAQAAAVLTAVLLAAAPGGCASAGGTAPRTMADRGVTEDRDPWDGFNRSMHAFNMKADEYVLRPVAGAYKENVPEKARSSLHNALANAGSLVILMNDVMQWEWGRAGVTAHRFVTNTVEGVGGLVDVAATRGIHRHTEDFGQTLAAWGVDSGPYLVLPLLGPSNPRDAFGRVVDGVADPLGYTGQAVVAPSLFVTEAVDARAETLEIVDDLQRSSLDFYATIRALYIQNRNNEIRNGASSGAQNPNVIAPTGGQIYDPSVFEDFDEPAPGQAPEPAPKSEAPAPSSEGPVSESPKTSSLSLSILAALPE